MLMIITFLTVLSQFPFGFTINHTCVPNTKFILNGRLCLCNGTGRWMEANCHTIGRRQKCQSGQIIWKGCNQCICQEDGHLECTISACLEETTTTSKASILRENSATVGTWCTPFQSYYINCSICICPASGWTSEATCALDTSCQGGLPSNFIANKNLCIPNVIYLFPCLQCLCSDKGYFILDKCIETCSSSTRIESPRRCISRTFYRKNCNVCWCPEDSVPDEKHCTNVICNKSSEFRLLEDLRKRSAKCSPNSFTKPKCYYCDCNTEGKINENACLDLDCLKSYDYNYDIIKKTCSPGEMVPICIECFCLKNGQTNNNYCTRKCSYVSKLSVLQNVLNDSVLNDSLIDIDNIKKTKVSEFCEPDSIYIDQGRYCLCPKTGNRHFKLCTSLTEEEIFTTRSHATVIGNDIKEESNDTCEPNTFVEIDCNICYCSRNGVIDRKWCTYDDCKAKRIIRKKTRVSLSSTLASQISDICTPGSISKADCNFCICSETGVVNDRICTRNTCEDLDQPIDNDALACEPLDYYIVDCNTCVCPQDGYKNVARCTKNACEKSFLRSEDCVPGQLFSVDCNVCVCPPNSNKADRVCTNHKCSDSDTPWKKIFMLSQSLLGVHNLEGTTRKLDVCFPGEEFEVDCKVCVCPDMGLRAYASCTPIVYYDEHSQKHYNHDSLNGSDRPENERLFNSRREAETCITYNLTDSSERKECTPGSMYIIRCRQCICPYMGNINHFCRPLPEGTYCEQAYPYFNYLPMGRRINQGNWTDHSTTEFIDIIPMNHNHTKYECAKPGRIMDDCFICECEDGNVLIEEHCFKNNIKSCIDVDRPTFLNDNKLVLN